MGVVQKGRSGTWLDDHTWWVVVIEFQPSGWSRGSYLNVGCMWLWQVKSYVSFDEGNRVAPFSGFEGEEQFRLVADRLARNAAQEVLRYRNLFSNVKKLCRYYLQHRPTAFWPSFHAAIACALSGELSESRRFFNRIIDSGEDDLDWVREARSDAKELSALASDPVGFRALIAERVRRTRELQRFPPVSEVDFGC